MKDRNEFIREFNDFLDSEDNVALVTGVDDDEKIKRVLTELNNQGYLNGTIYVDTLKNASFLLNRAWDQEKEKFPSRITRQETYSLYNLKLKFRKYSEKLNSQRISEKDDFAIYYPVQTALMPSEEKTFDNLMNHIAATRSNKTIIVTTNDQSIDLSKLSSVVDRHIHYKVINDNKELFETFKGNLNNSSYDRKKQINSLYEDLID